MSVIIPLKDLVDFAEIQAIAAIKKFRGVMPTFIGFSADNKKIYVGSTPDLANREKVKDGMMSKRQRMIAYFVLKCIEKNINRVVFFNEAWTLMTEDEEEGERWYSNLKEHPDSVESLIISGHTRDQKILKSYTIKRNNGEISLEKQFETNENLSGDFFNILPKNRPTKDVIDKAKTALEMWNEISDFRLEEVEV